MPIARRDNAELHWDSTGAGAPVLLVMGLGMNATGWWRTIPVLAERLRVSPSTTGRGAQQPPAGPVRVPQLADDAVGRARRRRRRPCARLRHLAGRHDRPGDRPAAPGPRRRARARRDDSGRTHAVAAATTRWPSSAAAARCRPRRPSGPACPTTTARARAPSTPTASAGLAQRLRFPIEPEPYKARSRGRARPRRPRPAARDRQAHADRARHRRPHGRAGQRAADRGGDPRRRPDDAARQHGHLYPTDEPEADRAVPALPQRAVQPEVHRDRRTGERTPGVARQERDDARHLGWLDQPLDGLRGQDHLFQHPLLGHAMRLA